MKISNPHKKIYMYKLFIYTLTSYYIEDWEDLGEVMENPLTETIAFGFTPEDALRSYIKKNPSKPQVNLKNLKIGTWNEGFRAIEYWSNNTQTSATYKLVEIPYEA
jgi:hypothetical protein